MANGNGRRPIVVWGTVAGSITAIVLLAGILFAPLRSLANSDAPPWAGKEFVRANMVKVMQVEAMVSDLRLEISQDKCDVQSGVLAAIMARLQAEPSDQYARDREREVRATIASLRNQIRAAGGIPRC